MWQTPLKSNLTHSADSSTSAIRDHSKFITVTCRLKPLFVHEEKSNIEIDTKTHAITLNDPTKSISKTYSFDEIFDENARQEQFTNRICEPLVGFLKNGGQSGLIFSYGITNSGKTYTILGTKQHPGILLTLIKNLQQQFKQQPLRIVACQLYKDQFYSLKTKGQKLHPRQFRGTFTFDQCHSDVINQNNMEQLFSQYLTNRSCSPTSFNTISSRSHAIFKIIGKRFRIGVVDLAGSERTAKGVENNGGVDLKETIFINSSLLTLKKCIKSLQDKSLLSQKICIPYRQSKLTQSLVQYFAPNSKISIIVNINQARHCLEQNINAMDYTSKAKNITANVMSDFSKMLKSTAKKREEIILAVKNYKLGKSAGKVNFVEVNKLTSSKVKSFTKNALVNSFPSKQKHLTNQQNQSQHSNPSQELYDVCKELESIEEQNENRKPSEHVSTTVCSTTEMETSNVHIEEIEYQQFNPQKQQNEHKIRYSVQYIGDDHKYIIEQQAIESEQFQSRLTCEIQAKQRQSFIDKKNIEQTYEQFIEQPFSIENFIKKQQEFRNYLAFDRQFEKQADERKLSALKKVSLFETTKKKEVTSEGQGVESDAPMEVNGNRVQTADVSVGTEIQDFVIKRQTQQLNQTIANIDLQKLRTNIKRKLLEVLKDEQKRWMVNNVDKENYHSLKKEQIKSANKGQNKFNVLEIDQTSPENQESNFTTPSKSIRQNLNFSHSQQKQCSNENSQLNQSLLKKTFEKVASGVKTGVQYMADKVGLANHIFRTNNKEIKSYGEEQKKQRNPRCEMKIWKQISQRIQPQDKVYFISSTSQQVQVTSTIKKVRFVSEKLELDDQNKLEYPSLQEKEIEVVVFEVGTQTESIQTKHILEDAIMEVMRSDHKKKNHKKNKRGPKREHDHEEDQMKRETQRIDKEKQLMEKTAFKCSSLKKDLGNQLKKRPEIVMSAKSAIAHKTRGARRKHNKC